MYTASFNCLTCIITKGILAFIFKPNARTLDAEVWIVAEQMPRMLVGGTIIANYVRYFLTPTISNIVAFYVSLVSSFNVYF